MRVAYLLVAATALVTGAGWVGAEQPKAQMTQQQGAETLVEQAQKKLAAMDLRPGPVNGIEHKQTRDAVKRFQKSQNLDVSGRLDAKTLAALGVRPTITMARSAPTINAPASEQLSMIASAAMVPSESDNASPSESSSAAPSEPRSTVSSEAGSAAPSESTSPPSESKRESSSGRTAEPASEPPKS